VKIAHSLDDLRPGPLPLDEQVREAYKAGYRDALRRAADAIAKRGQLDGHSASAWLRDRVRTTTATAWRAHLDRMRRDGTRTVARRKTSASTTRPRPAWPEDQHTAPDGRPVAFRADAFVDTVDEMFAALVQISGNFAVVETDADGNRTIAHYEASQEATR
jgi:hypothetical protein